MSGSESEAIEQRRRALWRPDYADQSAFLASVAPNRERWRVALGDFREEADPGEVLVEPWLADEDLEAWYVTLPWRGQLRLRAVFALPRQRSGRLPLVIAQHGISCSPERVFGFDDPDRLYFAYGRRLAADGYAVVAPLHITMAPQRARLHRLCLMLGRTIHGLEISQYHALLDHFLARPEVDPERVAMWGISMGGCYTLFALPLEERIRVGIVTAFFNHRVRKMVVDDPRHSCFLSTTEEHIFVPGWLREFCDSDLCHLIAPRPLQLQSGTADGISWHPWVAEEAAAAAEPYRRLGVPERFHWLLHEGGHEIRYEDGRDFLRRWL